MYGAPGWRHARARAPTPPSALAIYMEELAWRLPSLTRVRSSVPMRVTLVVLERMQVDVWIERFVICQSTRPDIENGRRTSGSVLQMMAITYAGREACTITGLQQLFTSIGHEYDFAVEHVHKLIFHCVPVPLTRPGTRWQHQ